MSDDKLGSIVLALFLGALTGYLALILYGASQNSWNFEGLATFYVPDTGTMVAVFLAGPIQGFLMGLFGGLIGRRLSKGRSWNYATLFGGAIGGAIIPLFFVFGDYLL